MDPTESRPCSIVTMETAVTSTVIMWTKIQVPFMGLNREEECIVFVTLML